MRPIVLTLMSVVLFLSIAACEGGGGNVPENCSTDDASNVDEGPDMEPGGDCIACHARDDEGPRYTIAGTVMGASHDDDRCVGIDGVTVEITGADGTVLTLDTNRVGNFFWQGALSTPYTAKVISGSGEKIMATPQTDGDCASCHTAEGASGAPGRVLAP